MPRTAPARRRPPEAHSPREVAPSPLGAGPSLIIGAILTVEISSALSVRAFASVDPAWASAVRHLISAVILLAVVRPRLMAPTRKDGGAVVAGGIGMTRRGGAGMAP